jgi:hypothetical protein
MRKRGLTVITISVLLSSCMSFPETQGNEDILVPVISFHQRRYDSQTQEYFLEIFANGTVVYRGVQDVRTPGTRIFVVSPQVVARAQRELNDLKPALDKGREFRGGTNSRVSSLSLVYGNEAWAKTFFGRTTPVREYQKMRDILEREFPTEPLRCPYWPGSAVPSGVPGGAMEICAYLNYTRDLLLKQDQEKTK